MADIYITLAEDIIDSDDHAYIASQLEDKLGDLGILVDDVRFI